MKSSVSLRIVTECFCSSRSKLTPHGPVRDFLSVHLHSAERYSAQQVILSKQVKTRKTVGSYFLINFLFCWVAEGYLQDPGFGQKFREVTNISSC